MSSIHDCKLIQLPRMYDRRGSLTYIYNSDYIPFDIQRVYYLYDVPGGESRGGHAHIHLRQLIVSVMGAFDVIVDDGHEKKRFHLDRAYYGLYIPTMIWRELDNFSSGGICLVMASTPYDEADYIRDYDEFKKRCKV